MKKTNKIKKIAILLSMAVSASFVSNAFADNLVEAQEVNTETANVATDAESGLIVKIENPQLRSILKSQKDAQELLNDSDMNMDATLGDIARYGALTAIQEAKNKLEGTLKETVANPQQGAMIQDGQPVYANNQVEGSSQQVVQQGNQQVNANANTTKNKKDEAPEIKATAVYKLGNVGYAELSYNGSKTVVKQGGKLPNGETVESLTPLSVVINNGKEKQTIPIIAEETSKGNSTVPSGDDFTLSAPRFN